MSAVAEFYFDVASPYAYLAANRVEEMLGPGVNWRPILVGAIHKHYRRVGWGATPELRAAGVAEIDARAVSYGLAPIVWPVPYPANSLVAMRAATWAASQGRVREFACSAFSLAFAHGTDLTERGAVLDAAERAGLDPRKLDWVLDDPELKNALRQNTDRAIEQKVYGVPTFDAGGLLWWGDHQLAAAAVAHASS